MEEGSVREKCLSRKKHNAMIQGSSPDLGMYNMLTCKPFTILLSKYSKIKAKVQKQEALHSNVV